MAAPHRPTSPHPHLLWQRQPGPRRPQPPPPSALPPPSGWPPGLRVWPPPRGQPPEPPAPHACGSRSSKQRQGACVTTAAAAAAAAGQGDSLCWIAVVQAAADSRDGNDLPGHHIVAHHTVGAQTCTIMRACPPTPPHGTCPHAPALKLSLNGHLPRLARLRQARPLTLLHRAPGLRLRLACLWRHSYRGAGGVARGANGAAGHEVNGRRGARWMQGCGLQVVNRAAG